MFVRVSISFFFIFALNIANINARPEISGRIVNGEDTVIKNIPYQVAVFPGDTLCGGSILNEYWIVTAAHCTEGLTFDQIEFSLGVQDIRTLEKKDYLKVSELIQHPNWNNDTYDSDISLIKAEVEIKFSPTVQPIKVQTSVPSDDSVVTASGYGDPHEDAEEPHGVLKSVELQLINFNTCNIAFGRSLTNNMICAGVPSYDKDTCQGDSGGPLTYDGKLLGIISFGDGCAKEDPGVYTKLLNYIPWMFKATGINFF